MPIVERFKTTYPGVYYIWGTSITSGKKERIYYIRYRKNGKPIEEKAGRQFQDDMTQARAARMRAQRIEGNQTSNQEQREAKKAAALAAVGKWTIDKLWEEYKTQKHDSKGLRVDKNRYQNYLENTFGKKEPKELVQFDVDRLRINSSKKKKPQTVKHILALLKRIINFGANKGLCHGPNFKIELPKVNNIKTEDLTPEQLNKLIEAIDNAENKQAAHLMKMVLFTGMRRGELFKLKWDDVDFERGFIYIKNPKGGIDEKIPLNEATRELLNSHPKTKSPFVFPGRKGKQRTDINHQVNEIKTNAGLPKDFRPLHGLRHTYASMMASSGQVDLYTLQKLLTHKNPKMTQRYAHLRDETLKNASNVASNLIEQTVNSKKAESVKTEQ